MSEFYDWESAGSLQLALHAAVERAGGSEADHVRIEIGYDHVTLHETFSVDIEDDT